MSKLFLVQAFAFCLVLSTGFWHGRTGSKRNVFSLSLTLCIHVVMECGYGDFIQCLCMNRISFWCELNTLTTVLTCLSPGCSCYGDSSQGGGIPFVPYNQCTLCHPCAVKNFLPVFFFSCFLRWEGSTRELAFFSFIFIVTNNLLIVLQCMEIDASCYLPFLRTK